MSKKKPDEPTPAPDDGTERPPHDWGEVAPTPGGPEPVPTYPVPPPTPGEDATRAATESTRDQYGAVTTRLEEGPPEIPPGAEPVVPPPPTPNNPAEEFPTPPHQTAPGWERADPGLRDPQTKQLIPGTGTGDSPGPHPHATAPSGGKARWLVSGVIGHKAAVVEAETPEEATQVYFRREGIIATEHAVKVQRHDAME